MAIRSDEYGYLFIEVPRTASQAIGKGVLIPKLGGQIVGTGGSHESTGDVHASQHELVDRGLLNQADLQRLLVFGTIRNPFDSMVTLYEKMSNNYAPMLDDSAAWVHDHPNYHQSMLVAQDAEFSEWLIFHMTRRKLFPVLIAAVRPPRKLPDYYRGMDRIISYENLQVDFNEVLKQLGADAIDIPKLNVTGRETDYRGYYTPKARRLAERAFSEYREEFGYTF